MHSWPDRRIIDLFGIGLPIIQAPMAGAQLHELAIAVSNAGGLGSLPCAMLKPEQLREEMKLIRAATGKPVNLNFFCHKAPEADPAREAAWKKKLEPYYLELGMDPNGDYPTANRAPFDDVMCEALEEIKPGVVSFHFGLPEQPLLDRLGKLGTKIIGCATTVAEARWLEERGCDAIIAQGAEAGGHRGLFLTADMASQVGTFALVPQVVDAVKVPVIAAGGIADGRGIAAAFALGASAVQIGTAYLSCPESSISAVYRKGLKQAKDDNTVITNVFTGRPARGIKNRLINDIGPVSDAAPAFPRAALSVAPLKAKAEAAGNSDFTQLWSGQAARLVPELPAAELTRKLAGDALALLERL